MWRLLMVLSSLWAASLLIAQPTPGYTAYQRASALFNEKKFAECQAAVDDSLRLEPGLVPALTLKAKLAMADGRLDVARRSLEQALATDPTSAYVYFLYGFQFYLSNDLPSALPQFEKARTLNPKDPRPALYLGMTRESLGQNDEAMSLYEQAGRLEKAAGTEQVDTLLVGARLLLVLGRRDDCRRWIEHALNLAPASRDAHFERARLLLGSEQALGAASEGEAALRLHGGSTSDVQIHYLLVRAYRDGGLPGKADLHVEALRRAEAEPK